MPHSESLGGSGHHEKVPYLWSESRGKQRVGKNDRNLF
jgi:hypothetical protein